MQQTCPKGSEFFITPVQITVDTQMQPQYFESQENSSGVMFGTCAALCEPPNSFSNDVLTLSIIECIS